MIIKGHELDKICADFNMSLKEICEDIEEISGLPFSYRWVRNTKSEIGQLTKTQSVIIRLYAKHRQGKKERRALRSVIRETKERLNGNG